MITPNLQKLLDALRSGEYTQGFEALARRYEGDVEYCCLGVASKLAADEGKVVMKVVMTRIVFDGKGHYMPLAAAEWLGVEVEEMGGDFNLYAIDPATADGLVTRASLLNDKGLPFPEIADAIEEYYRDHA